MCWLLLWLDTCGYLPAPNRRNSEFTNIYRFRQFPCCLCSHAVKTCLQLNHITTLCFTPQPYRTKHFLLCTPHVESHWNQNIMKLWQVSKEFKCSFMKSQTCSHKPAKGWFLNWDSSIWHKLVILFCSERSVEQAHSGFNNCCVKKTKYSKCKVVDKHS